MGLGDDYNEDLMQAMGEAGDGNYYYIESPLQLADIFQTELQGLMANLGQKVSLGLEPQGGARVVEVLNDLETNALGRLMLPNLIVGMPIPVVIRLQVPASNGEPEVCRVRLAWDDSRGGGRRSIYASLALRSCPSPAWDALPADPDVVEQVGMLMAARAKKEAIAAFDRGDMAGTFEHARCALRLMEALPSTEEVVHEREQIAQLREDLARGDGAKFRKRAAWQAFQRKRGQES
jgi:Ca-activated chloride channel family protein